MEQNILHYQSVMTKLDAQFQQLKADLIIMETLISPFLQMVYLGIHLMVGSNTMNSQLLKILIQKWDPVMVLASSISMETISERITHWLNLDARLVLLREKPNISVSDKSSVLLKTCHCQLKIKMRSPLVFL
jgi:hypothetical protein